MALIVFLRGVNVGGHRTFRPSVLARALSRFDVVNVGAAGTFIVRKPGSRARFRAALLKKLPFAAEIMFCDAAICSSSRPKIHSATSRHAPTSYDS